MIGLIRKNLSGKKILILFALTNIIYLVMLFITIPGVMSYSGGMKILDMMPSGYDANYVNSLLEALGERGRHAYLFYQIPLDMIYPFLFAVTYCLIMAYLIKKIAKPESRLFYLAIFPFFSGIFDYCENIGIITILTKFPGNLSTVSNVTNVFSVLKSISTTISFSLILIFLIIFVFRLLFK